MHRNRLSLNGKNMEINNSSVRCVFSPKTPENFNGRKRFIISVDKLSSYITENNALTALNQFKKCKSDKCTIKFRKYGKIEIYSK